MLNVACIIAGSYKIAATTKLGRFLGRCQRYTMASVKAQPCVNLDKCHGTGQDDASRDWVSGCQPLCLSRHREMSNVSHGPERCQL